MSAQLDHSSAAIAALWILFHKFWSHEYRCRYYWRVFKTEITGVQIALCIFQLHRKCYLYMNTNKAACSTSQRNLQDPDGQANPQDLRYSVTELKCELPNEDACLEHIKEARWPNSVTRCKKCNVERKHSRVTGRTAYACDYCGNHIYPLKGTVFARSSTSLKTWFYVIHRVASAERGITAKRIQRETGVTYKTAWRMLRHARQLVVNQQTQSAPSVRGISATDILRILRDGSVAPTRQRETDVTIGAA